MGKHITDHPRRSDGQAGQILTAGLRVDDTARHPASKALHKRKTKTSQQRTPRYLKIEAQTDR